ncbi:two pore domain potassium channel family protein [Aquitalea sp. LB_tupeE]|uniref:two pore domain potassium channel family protein n=1 Tax=Aquitalea sp. LB_tupeE TaxID=2748078 RepID=UPI0015BBF627|nr:two pore domain potassium channel family protein [Aquitalea sp. LB_tupeE]NWK76855.1 two pore domain potassium channel family protein [Aquitalea sp. LB_tupeE]
MIDFDPKKISKMAIDIPEPEHAVDMAINVWRSRFFFYLLAAWVSIASIMMSFGGIGQFAILHAVSNSSSNGGHITVEQTIDNSINLATALYYNTAMISTIGAADIAPVNYSARTISLIDSFMGVFLLGIIISLICKTFDGNASDLAKTVFNHIAFEKNKLRKKLFRMKFEFRKSLHKDQDKPKKNSIDIRKIIHNDETLTSVRQIIKSSEMIVSLLHTKIIDQSNENNIVINKITHELSLMHLSHSQLNADMLNIILDEKINENIRKIIHNDETLTSVRQIIKSSEMIFSLLHTKIIDQSNSNNIVINEIKHQLSLMHLFYSQLNVEMFDITLDEKTNENIRETKI